MPEYSCLLNCDCSNIHLIPVCYRMMLVVAKRFQCTSGVNEAVCRER